MPPRNEWYGLRMNGTYGRVDPRTILTQPADYVPFQSVLQPDGRYAYNPWGRQYPQFGVLVEPWQRIDPRLFMPANMSLDTPFPLETRQQRQEALLAEQAYQAQLAEQARQAQLNQQARQAPAWNGPRQYNYETGRWGQYMGSWR